MGVLHDLSRGLGFQVPEKHLEIPETREEILKRAMTESGDRPERLVARSLGSIVRRSSM